MCYIVGYLDSSLIDDFFSCFNRIKSKNFTIICQDNINHFGCCRLGFIFSEELTLSQVRTLLYSYFPINLFLRKFLSLDRLKRFLKVGL